MQGCHRNAIKTPQEAPLRPPRNLTTAPHKPPRGPRDILANILEACDPRRDGGMGRRPSDS
eukprot:2530088-Pyramimonas_sp.AAC.2